MDFFASVVYGLYLSVFLVCLYVLWVCVKRRRNKNILDSGPSEAEVKKMLENCSNNSRDCCHFPALN